MTAHKLEVSRLINPLVNNNTDEYSIPLDISDLISICREFNKLGWQIQNQIEYILEFGVEESLKSGNVKRESLPYIKNFLKFICKNPYFGDSVLQAEECIYLISIYEEVNKSNISPILN
ncbi:hypothetical protein UFOVP1290_381 [uncultured Caudovirales phage]|uniref:Uncharacterized protein n=1 Tax=uncultured Caudovirales phage TaxID=2100421 RepID=A0A6J5RTH0_9CAUD|nr:hypothetical protein UFOVP1290_381 [uncultured Caudovirales phage]